ncbi:MAG: ATP-binding cassette domain-containing protein [Pseudolysinimonas sp.]|uniref:ABC transporter ATP-binding protein n=1 Tax=Pseudolysinimonas sp. TaxID=2680009 RepID=UPI003265974C
MRIAVEGLEHRYRLSADPVVGPLTHAFEPGTLTAVTGPSGSGKSTVLYLTALMLTPDTGVVRWGNDDVHGLRDADRARLRARHAGFVFQDAVLDLSRTALQNVMEAAWLAGMDPDLARPRGRELLDRFGLEERADHLPGELSGGQAQRVALCRALVKSPDVIFADEPTGNLDVESADTVWAAMREAADAGATVIVATHDAKRARKSDNHLRLV